MRALDPVTSGFARVPGGDTPIHYEAFGDQNAARTVVFSPAGVYAHSRLWKMQVPYFARLGFRVVTYDCRGSGASGPSSGPFTPALLAEDTLAVMDTLGVERAALVGMTRSLRWLGRIATEHPQRVTHLVSVGTFPGMNQTAPYTLTEATKRLEWFLTESSAEEAIRDEPVTWRADHMLHRYPAMTSWQATEDFPEPHSTKAIEDLTAWSRATTPATLVASCVDLTTGDDNRYLAQIRCPTLILHGEEDAAIPVATARAVHEAIPHSKLVIFGGSGHVPVVRDAVRSNHVIHDFLDGRPQRGTTWQRAMARREKKALFVSSPIGLGHSQRDVAVARELRALVPDLKIEWLAQHPVTRVLEANGETIHPASAMLAGESPHIESLMGAQHELNVFQAIREMDEILLANFHVFHDVAREGNYDLWVGDEAWEVDYYLHENPELKTAPFAWLTDFVGYLPMVGGPDGREAFVTADYNAEMIEQVARYRRVRDASLYIGDEPDIVPDSFGPDLPLIAEWVGDNFEHNGYIRYFDPAELGHRGEIRQRFGFQDGERVAVAAVGGTSVGASLLTRIVESFPAARDALPDLRLAVVCGPRIDPASLPQVAGVEYLGYVHNLYEMLTAADVALVQGGLSTTMELVGAGTPFLYFPLTNHFEQNRHVAHRLERYGVPTWAKVAFAKTGGDWLTDKLTRLLDAPPHYREVAPGGARRAAERLAALL
ncbi:MAG TPA: alpha/beta fold hydrolase [Trueperaceae bacterium]|nr:alpha/beta fold hydrolase [Trueperaceae bacterium]